MTPFDRLLDALFQGDFTLDIWFFVKILFLIGLAFYLAFAVIVVRQVNLMAKAVNVPMEIPLRLIAWVHLLAAIGLFLLALVIL